LISGTADHTVTCSWPENSGVDEFLDGTRIDDRPVDLDPLDLTIWVSDDNVTYRKFTGKCDVEDRIRTWRDRERRCFAFREMDVRDRFIAFTCADAKGRFFNRIRDLAEVLDADGNTIEFILGLAQVTAPGVDDPRGVRPSYRRRTGPANESIRRQAVANTANGIGRAAAGGDVVPTARELE